ncbi:TIGR00730 family Rossman fold protein [Kocuria massiliensis]|uniref:LOG family protein n=1 Tax=Kocuria massiliensis TaxID=1926282 RepID=UPI0022B96782|nr:TIGR00730 family Rossman fold protein [Kocuria massiliensis]
MPSDNAFASAPAASNPLRRVTAYTGSAAGVDPVYSEAVRRLGVALAGRGVGVVYGGGKVGLMGILADSVMAVGGKVSGVMPRALADAEIAHEGLTDLEIVQDMHQRKNRMAELGDAFIALPGGAGTLEELFETWTWQHLGLHAKPVALYNVKGFWNPLLDLLDHMVEEGFLRQELRDSLIVESEPAPLLEALAQWHPATPKWDRQG